MQRLKDIHYEDFSIITTKDAGMEGFRIDHKDYGTLIRIHIDDIRLLKAVETALHNEYGEEEN